MRLMIFSSTMTRIVLSAALTVLFLSACTMHEPADLMKNRGDYETLALTVAEKLKPGDILNRKEAEGEMHRLMRNLDVFRVRYDLAGDFISLDGRSNIITGAFSYLYRLGEADIDMMEGRTDGIERRHVDGRWYIQKAHWD